MHHPHSQAALASPQLQVRVSGGAVEEEEQEEEVGRVGE